jgi:hypothetical protein
MAEEFKSGLEGVVAFQTEIAEPDKEGGSLRYRGVDIDDLVGSVPFEKVWPSSRRPGASSPCSTSTTTRRATTWPGPR